MERAEWTITSYPRSVNSLACYHQFLLITLKFPGLRSTKVPGILLLRRSHQGNSIEDKKPLKCGVVCWGPSVQHHATSRGVIWGCSKWGTSRHSVTRGTCLQRYEPWEVCTHVSCCHGTSLGPRRAHGIRATAPATEIFPMPFTLVGNFIQ